LPKYVWSLLIYNPRDRIPCSWISSWKKWTVWHKIYSLGEFFTVSNFCHWRRTGFWHWHRIHKGEYRDFKHISYRQSCQYINVEDMIRSYLELHGLWFQVAASVLIIQFNDSFLSVNILQMMEKCPNMLLKVSQKFAKKIWSWNRMGEWTLELYNNTNSNMFPQRRKF